MNLLSSLYGFAVCLEIFALAAMLRFLWNMINRFRRNPKTMERRRQQKLGRDGFLLIMTGVLFFAGMAFLNFALFIQSYRTFAVGEPIAKISVVGSPEDHSFIAKIEELGKPLRNQFSPMNHEYSIKGDRWMMEGQIGRAHV
mgnify:CR=1 FL=1